MSDIAASQYPDFVGPLTYNLNVQKSVAGTGTVAIGAVLPWFIAMKDTWIDQMKLVVAASSISASSGAILTLKMAPSGTLLSAGTTIATTQELNTIIGDSTVMDRPDAYTAAGTGAILSNIRIPSGYWVGWVVSGAAIAEETSFCATALIRQKAQ